MEQISRAFRAAGGDGDLSRLPDAALAASLRSAGLDGGRGSVTFDDPIAYGFPPTSGFADDPVNTATGNFLLAESDFPSWRRVYNSRLDGAGAFGPGWSSWADVRLAATAEGAAYAGPDGQRAVFPRHGGGYGRIAGVAAWVRPHGDGLELAWADGRSWIFDAAGRPVTADRTAFGHDTEGRLVTAGPVTLTWDGDRIVAATSAGGRRVVYAYDDGGALTGVGDRRFELDERQRIVAAVDADGVAEARNTYDDAGRVVTQTRNFGNIANFVYLPGRVTVVGETDTYVHDQQGRLLAVTDGLGRTLRRTYDEWGNPVTVTDRNGHTVTMRWDEHGRLLERDGFRYTYDEFGRVVTVVAPTGGQVHHRYEGAGRIPSEIRDAEGGLTRLDVRDGLVHGVTDPDGVTLTFTLDGAGQVTAVTDGLGNTARVDRDPDGRVLATTTPLGRRTTFRHDARGHLVERTDPAGHSRHYEYTPAGRLTAIVDPSGARRETRYGEHGAVTATVDPLGHETTRAYDPFGNLARLTTSDGGAWDFTYDVLSRLTGVTDPSGATWLHEYDPEGHRTGTVDPVGVRRTATVDTQGRVTGIGDGLTGSTFEHDPLGRTTAHGRPDGTTARAGYDRCGRRTTIEDPSGGVTRIEYTPAGRVRRTTSPGGRVTTCEYDAAGRRTAVVDGAGRRTVCRYDADGNLTAAGTITLDYDDAGHLIRRGHLRFGYDNAGRLTAIGARRFEYDPAGRVSAAIDPLGRRTTYRHDSLGRLTAITDPLGNTCTREYDQAGRLVVETDALGRSTRFVHDAAGRLVGRTDGAGRTVRWTHDGSGRIVTITAGDGATITFRRDSLGRPVVIDEPGRRHRFRWDRAGRLVAKDRDGLTLRHRYGPDGERQATVLPDGTEITRGYDDGGLLSAVGTVTLRRDALGRLIGTDSGVTWEHDADGRIMQAGDRLTRHDAAGQLVAEGQTRFAYDESGRLVADGDVACVYDAAGQLVSRGGVVYEYDGSGRRIREGDRRSYEWDVFGRLAAVVVDGHRIPVGVDITGELASVADRAVLWDPGPAGPPCWLGDAPLPPSWTAPSADWQGTPDGDSRDAWGAPALTDPGIGFRGELEFAGLTWLRHRVYDPSSRSFLSPDPLPAVPGTAWSGNPYHYAGNDPVGHADPSGLRPITDAELRSYRDDMGSGFFEDAADWVGDNWEYLAAGAMIVGGVALMFTGVGGPAGIALMAASGGLLAGGISAGVQKFTTGEVDWGQVAVDGLIGAAGGGLGAGAAAVASNSARLAATNPFVRELAINGAESLVGGGVERGLTGGDIFNPRALATDLLSGGTVPAPGGRVGGSGAADDLIDVYRFHTAADPSTLRSPLSDHPDIQDWVRANRLSTPEQLRAAAEAHATGNTSLSPFVSITTDPLAAARTTDPGLSAIINGTPHPAYRQAPDLSHFQVPRDRVVWPSNQLSLSEGEGLFHGDDLADFLVDTRPNPFPMSPPGGVP
ncbi:DUF6531 domain-containing protein [Actinoplanes sp. NBRC 101535]|uniref:DUF6531 domain-containing protein n=1 Tax=Actinoplanes sp. NBRC 101535 TaxID=3032196 RepID=UPI0025550C44|nr:DUF6531 domain-containing protein [Actinoplanes sp. NBRC 101535]